MVLNLKLIYFKVKNCLYFWINSYRGYMNRFIDSIFYLQENLKPGILLKFIIKIKNLLVFLSIFHYKHDKISRMLTTSSPIIKN